MVKRVSKKKSSFDLSFGLGVLALLCAIALILYFNTPLECEFPQTTESPVGE